MNQRFITFASVISEIEQSDIFMTVKARILETPKANLNGARVTEAFVDDIIANKERYIGLPLYADKKALDSGKYNRLGHLYDSKTGEFHSTQIGSFYDFEKEDFSGGSYLVGYARIPKRDKDLSRAIAELFADGKLKFSFEIACAEYSDLDDGTIEIDASEHNYLEGTAIVTFPACEDAVALEFVAQREADDQERGDEEMAEETQVVAEENVETTVEAAEATPQIAEEKAKEPETSETENAACDEDEKKKADETAAVHVTETYTERVDTYMYDMDSGKDVCQSIEVRTSVSDTVDGEIVEADDGVHVAEADGDSSDSGAEQNDSSDNADADSTSNDSSEDSASNTDPEPEPAGDNAPSEDQSDLEGFVVPVDKLELKNFAEMIASLSKEVEKLTAELKTLKEDQKKEFVASRTIVAETVNPFVDDMTAKGNKYSLLEKDSPVQTHTLLSR